MVDLLLMDEFYLIRVPVVLLSKELLTYFSVLVGLRNNASETEHVELLSTQLN